MRRPDPLYIASGVIAVITIVVLVLTATGPSSGPARTGSALDDGSGGAGALRRYLSAMGASTRVLEGESFDTGDARVLLLLGAQEAVTAGDTEKLRSFVRAGGTLVVAVELGLFEESLLNAFDIRPSGVAAPGPHPLSSAAFADPPARALVIDRGITLAPGRAAEVLATDGRAPVIAATRSGNGLFVVVGSLWPFIGGGLPEGDNARLVLSLVRPALGGGTVAFDEYHHGVHPSSDVLVLLEQTWPGRAVLFAGALTFLYLVLSGRRLGPPVPLVARASRSSLDYIRGFAGLVRRSGRGEIARRRLRSDLRTGLARQLGLDPAMPFDRVLNAVAAQDTGRAARARAIDDALARPLREDVLLRTVAQIDELMSAP